MSVIADLPDIRPSLLLDFANSRRVHPLIQCTRASTATCYGPDGKLRIVDSHVPRIDYDPATGKCLGILVEESRTNQCLYSEDLTNAAWTKTSISAVATTEVNPSGLASATKLTPAASAGQKFVSQNISVSAGTAYTQKLYAKASGYNWLQIATSTGFASSYQNVDLVNGVAGSGDMQASLTIRKVGASGWIEISVSATATLTTTSGRFAILPIASDAGGRLPTAAGDGSSGALVWGVNFEAGAFATSYIPTTTAAATRAADLVSIDYTLPTVGAIVASVAGLDLANAANAYLWSAANPADRNADHAYCYLSSAPNRANWWVNKGGVGQSGGNIVGRPPSVGVSFDATARAAAIASGSLLTKDTIRPRDFPANLSQLRLGCNNANGGFLGGCISRLAVYSGRITDAQLQRLTA